MKSCIMQNASLKAKQKVEKKARQYSRVVEIKKMFRDRMEPFAFESKQLYLPVDLLAFLITRYSFLTSSTLPFALRTNRKSLSLIGAPLKSHSYCRESVRLPVSCPPQTSCRLLPRKPDTREAGKLVNLRPSSLSPLPHAIAVGRREREREKGRIN